MCDAKHRFILSNPLLRSGTAAGALTREAEDAESNADFKDKMSIAQKEINETFYWLELLKETGYLTDERFLSINNNAVEVIKLLTSIIKSTKANIAAQWIIVQLLKAR